MSVKEQQTVVGGAVWVCLTCGYISHDHIFVETAKATAFLAFQHIVLYTENGFTIKPDIHKKIVKKYLSTS